MQYVTNWTQPAKRRAIAPFYTQNVPTSKANGASDRCRLVYIEVTEACLVDGIYVYNFATVAGSVTVGLYNSITKDTPVGGALVAYSSSTALAGANASQFIPFTASVSIPAGQYWIVSMFSDNTHTYGETTMLSLAEGVYACYYNRGGGYGTPDTPCPALGGNSTTTPNVYLRVYKV
jgi:hypothetical protein